MDDGQAHTQLQTIFPPVARLWVLVRVQGPQYVVGRLGGELQERLFGAISYTILGSIRLPSSLVFLTRPVHYL